MNKNMKPLQPIVNLNFLNKENLIIDDEDRVFVVLDKRDYSDGTTLLKLLQVSNGFVIWQVTLPTACNKDYHFISGSDKSFDFKIFDTGILAVHLLAEMNIFINKKLEE